MLIVALPHAPGSESLDFVLSHDGLRVAQPGNAAAKDLPVHAPLIAVLPNSRLSWHRVKLPPLARPQRLAAAIGLLEDQWLQPAGSLHLSLHAIPDASPDQDNHWVCACDADWLRHSLEPLVRCARMPQRLVPEFAPTSLDQAEALFVTGSADQMSAVWCRPSGVLSSPWPAPWPLLRATPVTLLAEPALVEHVSTAGAAAQPADVQTQTRGQRWLQAAAGPWDLAQGEWSQTRAQRTWRRLQSVGRSCWHAPHWRPARWALWSLLGAHALGLLTWSWFMSQSLLDQQQQLQRLLKLTFPETTLVVDAPLQMQQALQRLRTQVGAAHPAQPEVMMGLLMGTVPGSNTLRGIRYDGRTLVLHMQTPPSLNADQQRRLQQLGYVVKLTRESVSLTWEGTP